MWEKWVLLATLGGITCLMRGTIGEIERAGRRTDFAPLPRRGRHGGHAAAASRRGGLPGETPGQLTAKGSTHASSMYRDLQAGRADRGRPDHRRPAGPCAVASTCRRRSWPRPTPPLDPPGEYVPMSESARGPWRRPGDRPKTPRRPPVRRPGPAAFPSPRSPGTPWVDATTKPQPIQSLRPAAAPAGPSARCRCRRARSGCCRRTDRIGPTTLRR